MTLYFVGPGGSDTNDGLTWATRRATIAGGLSLCAAGDTLVVGPGTYREEVSVNKSGAAGSPITIMGDVTGRLTDGKGGIVRVTGSDDDQTITRFGCFSTVAAGYNYITLKGLALDGTAYNLVRNAHGPVGWTVEDCFLQHTGTVTGNGAIEFDSDGQASCTIRRCVIVGGFQYAIRFYISTAPGVGNAGHTIEDCLIIAPVVYDAINITRVGGVTIRNCTIIGAGDDLIDLGVSADTPTAVTVEHCILGWAKGAALSADVLGNLVEDYNVFIRNATDRVNVDTGANSISSISAFMPPLLEAGVRMPWIPFAPAPWAAFRYLGGTGSDADLFGISRPPSGKRSAGAIQYPPAEIEETTVRAGSRALKLADAGREGFFVPVDPVSTAISVWVYRETGYTGANNPQMIISQPGQSDIVVEDTGAAGQWNQLTATFTPASAPKWVWVQLASFNTATTGSYAVYFDDLSVS